MLIRNAPSIAASLLLSVSLILGGSGAPQHELVIELTGVLGLAVALMNGKGQIRGKEMALPLTLIAFLLLVVLIQLVPLAPSIWSGLPGRENLWRTAEAVGLSHTYRPISLDPEATLVGALSLVPAVTMFLLSISLTERELTRTMYVLLALINLHLMAAALQLGSGGISFYLYDTPHRGVPVGLFANRNHLGTLLLIGAICASAVVASWPVLKKAALVAIIFGINFAFGAGVIATNSRTAAALLPIVLLGAALLLITRRVSTMRLIAGVAVLTLALAAIGNLSFSSASPVAKLVARFETFYAGNESRFGIWQDTFYAAKHYFPLGSGIGTFPAVFSSEERLSEVGTHYANQAHNDYLEILLETGLFGIVLLIGFFYWFISRSFHIWRQPRTSSLGLLGRAASIALLVALLHSIVDYPLRMPAIMTTFGLLVGLLQRSADPGPAKKPLGRHLS